MKPYKVARLKEQLKEREILKDGDNDEVLELVPDPTKKGCREAGGPPLCDDNEILTYAVKLCKFLKAYTESDDNESGDENRGGRTAEEWLPHQHEGGASGG